MSVDLIKMGLEEVKANNAEVQGKIDTVIEKLQSQQNSGGATAEQLAEVLALVNDVKAGVQGSEDKLDAVVTASADQPTEQPTPEPTPEPTV